MSLITHPARTRAANTQLLSSYTAPQPKPGLVSWRRKRTDSPSRGHSRQGLAKQLAQSLPGRANRQ